MAYRIVTESTENLDSILLDVRRWFVESRDFRCEVSTETRKFQHPESKQIEDRSIDTLKLLDQSNGKETVVKLIPLLKENEVKVEINGDNEYVVRGKIKNQIKKRGVFKSYNKDTLKTLKV